MILAVSVAAAAPVELEVLAEGLDAPAHLAFVEETLVAASGARLVVLGEGGPTSWEGFDCGPGCSVRSFAVAPDFAETGNLFVSTVREQNGLADVTLQQYRTDPGLPVGTSPLIPGTTLFGARAPSPHHLGGSVAVDAAGHVFLALGDGTKAGDRDGHGQNPNTPWGGIHRFALGTEAPHAAPGNPALGGMPTLWATGLRDPWILSIPGEQLVVADVGRFTHELTVAHAGDNLGWPLTEGRRCRQKPCPPELTTPFLEMGVKEAGAHWHLGASPLKGPFAGRLLFATSDHVQGLALPGNEAQPVVDLRGFGSAFAVDAEGEVFVASRLTGKVYHLLVATDGE